MCTSARPPRVLKTQYHFPIPNPTALPLHPHQPGRTSTNNTHGTTNDRAPQPTPTASSPTNPLNHTTTHLTGENGDRLNYLATSQLVRFPLQQGLVMKILCARGCVEHRLTSACADDRGVLLH